MPSRAREWPQNFLSAICFLHIPFFFCWHEVFNVEEQRLGFTAPRCSDSDFPFFPMHSQKKVSHSLLPPPLKTHFQFDLLSEHHQWLFYHRHQRHCLSCLPDVSVMYNPSSSSFSTSPSCGDTMQIILVTRTVNHISPFFFIYEAALSIWV